MDESTEARPKKYRNKNWLGALVVMFILVIISGLYIYRTHRSSNPFPKNIRSNVNFSLYYPLNLPEGLYVDSSSFRLSEANQAVLYTIMQGGSAKYEISIQAYPGDFDFTAFKKKFSEVDEFSSPIGSILIGDVGSQLLSSIRTDENSWVLIYTNDTSANGQLGSLARSFRMIE